MTTVSSVVRVALPCTGLGIQRRGFETFSREAGAALAGRVGLDLRVFGGGGQLEPDERAVWNLPRTSGLARGLARLRGVDPYFIEQVSFFTGFLPHLLTWKPHLVYFADLNFGNACWHWRRLTGARFRMLFYNGGPTTRPFTRCDFVQQVTPDHFASAITRGESADRMFMLPHGLDLPAALPSRDPRRIAETRALLGAAPGRKLLLSVGMLGSTLKRMDDLVDAVAAMGSERPYLVMLGQSTEETAALVAQARLRLGDDVRLDTWPKERMADAYAAADAFALLSLNEGFGLAYAEALAAGLPVVATDNPSTRYILGEQAMLGDTSSTASIVALLARALREETNDDLRHRRFAWVHGRFSWKVLAPRYAGALLTCAAGRKPAGDLP
jgi:glycosyltransferase involved in cell wall biosynthesis